MNLDKSISLLDDSVFLKRGLIRNNDDRSQLPLNSSKFLNSMEIDRMSSSILSESNTILAKKQKPDQLFESFLSILKTRTNDMEIFDTIVDLIQTCSDLLDEIGEGAPRGLLESKKDDIWLINERNTWQLLYCLYKDRIINQKEDVYIEELLINSSEKQIVEQLYESNSILREYQLIVDWLERCALENGAVQIGLYTDKTIGWENTLHQLKNLETMFGTGREIVKSMDPDASFREKLPLHDLDMADEARLSKQVNLNK